jgi:class 3 adenylate cyclase
VRVAVHAGEVQEREADFFGAVVNRCARLRAIGHGGQVLVSGVAAELVREDLPQGAYLRELGVHRLKDLAAPEQVFQLCHPDLRVEFPPELAGGPTEQPPAAADQFRRSRRRAG